MEIKFKKKTNDKDILSSDFINCCISVLNLSELNGSLNYQFHFNYITCVTWSYIFIEYWLCDNLLFLIMKYCCLVVTLLPRGLYSQAPLPMAFPRQEYWCGWPVPSPGIVRLVLLSRFGQRKVSPGMVLLSSVIAYALFSLVTTQTSPTQRDFSWLGTQSLQLSQPPPYPQPPSPSFIFSVTRYFLSPSHPMNSHFHLFVFALASFYFLLKHKLREDRNTVSFIYCCISCVWHNVGSSINFF